MIRSVAILGAGNGGAAAAAHLGTRGYDIRLWSRRECTLAPFLAQGGVGYAGVFGEGFQPVSVITSDVRTAVNGADLVLITAPTDAHEFIARAVGPHLTSEQVILAAPGHTLLLIPRILRQVGVATEFCEMGSLPYFARLREPGHVTVTKVAERMSFATFPGSEVKRLARIVAPVYPCIEAKSTILETVFSYINAVLTPAMICNMGWIESTKGDFYYYYDGITPSIGRLIDALDLERLAVGRALGVNPLPLVEEFFRTGFTTEEARLTGLAYEAWHQSEPDRWIRAPASLDHRFMDEDVAFGLVPLSELGSLGRVATPGIDAMIVIAERARGKDYRSSGLTLHRMGLAGVDRQLIGDLLRRGFADERSPHTE